MHLCFAFLLIKCPQPSWLNIMNQTEWYPLPVNFFLVTRLYYLHPTWLGVHLWSMAFISFLSSHMLQSSSSRVFQTTLMISRPPNMIRTMISIWNWHWLSFLSSVSVWGFKIMQKKVPQVRILKLVTILTVYWKLWLFN